MVISILIPVYRQPKFLGDILAKLLANSYPAKEILVIIDGQANPEIDKAIEPYRDKITVYENGVRQGKVKSLNYLSRMAKGEVLLFLDNDVQLPEDNNFLARLSQQVKGYDVVELPKEAMANNFFARITSYDFLAVSILSFLVSRTFRKSLFLCGAAFAIRKKTFAEVGGFSRVISEDWDLMLKAFRAGKTYWLARELKVKTVTPDNLEDWMRQRNRWASGAAHCWKEILTDIRLHLRGLPIIINILLFSFFPVVVGLVIKKIHIISKFFPLLFVLTQHLSTNLGLSSSVYLLSLMFLILQGIGPFLVSMLLSVTTFFLFSRVLGFRFSVWEFLIYSVFYFPFVVLIYFVYFVLGKALSLQLDWQVG